MVNDMDNMGLGPAKQWKTRDCSLHLHSDLFNNSIPDQTVALKGQNCILSWERAGLRYYKGVCIYILKNVYTALLFSYLILNLITSVCIMCVAWRGHFVVQHTVVQRQINYLLILDPYYNTLYVWVPKSVQNTWHQWNCNIYKTHLLVSVQIFLEPAVPIWSRMCLG